MTMHNRPQVSTRITMAGVFAALGALMSGQKDLTTVQRLFGSRGKSRQPKFAPGSGSGPRPLELGARRECRRAIKNCAGVAKRMGRAVNT